MDLQQQQVQQKHPLSHSERIKELIHSIELEASAPEISINSKAELMFILNWLNIAYAASLIGRAMFTAHILTQYRSSKTLFNNAKNILTNIGQYYVQ